jgi:sarcosine oxidase subunit beta
MPVARAPPVLALQGEPAYTFQMPVFKDLGSPGMLYCRSYGGTRCWSVEGTAGETLPEPDNQQGDVSMDFVAEIGAQVAERFPSFETGRPRVVAGPASTT